MSNRLLVEHFVQANKNAWLTFFEKMRATILCRRIIACTASREKFPFFSGSFYFILSIIFPLQCSYSFPKTNMCNFGHFLIVMLSCSVKVLIYFQLDVHIFNCKEITKNYEIFAVDKKGMMLIS